MDIALWLSVSFWVVLVGTLFLGADTARSNKYFVGQVLFAVGVGIIFYIIATSIQSLITNGLCH